MCQICAYSAGRKTSVKDLLREFFSHCEEHPHGWGIADFDGGEAKIEKEPVKASESVRLGEILSGPCVKGNFFAHIRRATVGLQNDRNCHPFTATDISGRRWTLMHNGTLFERTPADDVSRRVTGETDSERILLYIVKLMDAAILATGSPPDGEWRFRIVENAVRELAPGNKINLAIYDGDVMYVHASQKGTLYVRPFDGGKLFCTVPLDGGPWREVPLTRLIAVKDGRILKIAPPHGHEYVFDPKHLEMLYLNYANL